MDEILEDATGAAELLATLVDMVVMDKLRKVYSHDYWSLER